MASSKKEIEIKAKITDYKNLLLNLQELHISLSKPISQRDRVFWPIGTTHKDLRSGTSVLRIRQEGDKVLFTLKKRAGERELTKTEKEITVSDAATLKDIVELIGFYEVLQINKVRMTAAYKKYHICIDEIEGLGHFIEIEHITSTDEEKAVEHMRSLLYLLGIQEHDLIEKGYDTLLLQKKGLI